MYIFVYICFYVYIYICICMSQRFLYCTDICIMQPDAATLGAYVTRYISRSLVSFGRRGWKAVSSFLLSPIFLERWKWKRGGGNRFTPFSHRALAFLHIWNPDCGLATYPAIVEISTATDRQSGFRLHRVRQRDLKSFLFINGIFMGGRIVVDWNFF